MSTTTDCLIRKGSSLILVLRIRSILKWIWIFESVSWNNGSEKLPTFVLLFFYKKNEQFCYLRGKYLFPLNISLIILKELELYDIHMILVDFCGNFLWFWLIFCYPDLADQNERIKTDPDPRHFLIQTCSVGGAGDGGYTAWPRDPPVRPRRAHSDARVLLQV